MLSRMLLLACDTDSVTTENYKIVNLSGNCSHLNYLLYRLTFVGQCYDNRVTSLCICVDVV